MTTRSRLVLVVQIIKGLNVSSTDDQYLLILADTLSLESGNMLIMMLAQARITGDGTLLNQHVCIVIACCQSLADHHGNSIT